MLFRSILWRQLRERTRRLAAAPATKIFLGVLAVELLFGTCFYFAERRIQPKLTYWDALWWGMVTMTTVGYGDYYAKTALGRFLISIPNMLIGIGVFSYVVSAIANSMTQLNRNKRRGLMTLKLKGHIVFCHCHDTNKVAALIEEVRAIPRYSNKKIVLMDDDWNEMPEPFRRSNTAFVKGSPTDEATLERANLRQALGIIVLGKRDLGSSSDATVFSVCEVIRRLLGDRASRVKVVAETFSKTGEHLFASQTADGTVSADGVQTAMLAQEFKNPGIYKVFSQLLTSKIGSQLYVCSSTPGRFKTIRDLSLALLESNVSARLIGVLRNQQGILSPDLSLELKDEEHLIFIAESDATLKAFGLELV